VVYRWRLRRARRFPTLHDGTVGNSHQRQRASEHGHPGAVAHGKDPAAEKANERGAGPTVNEMAERSWPIMWSKNASLERSCFYRLLLDKFIRPEIGTAKADKETRAMVAKLHGS
jgi:hypothetical protein